MAASAFGPYLFSGLRTEQIAVYATFVGLSVGLWWMKARPNGHGVAVLVLLMLQLAVAVIGSVDPPQNTSIYQLGDTLAGIDNLALPMAVIAIVWMIDATDSVRQTLVRIVCRVTVAMMLLNAGLAVLATGGGGPDLSAFQGTGAVESVAFRAEQMGRLSGIFNQPAEGGLMYSVALLAAIYLFSKRVLLLAITSIALTIGGVLTISKVFLFIGLPIGIWQIMRSTGGRLRRLVVLFVVLVAVWAAAISGLAPKWAGENFLLRLLPASGQDPVGLYTAGRFGSGSSLAINIETVSASSPIWGFGAGGLQAAYDNGWVEALAMTGFVGAALLTLVMAVLVHAWWSRRTTGEDVDSRLAGGLVALVIAAALGVPSLTVNRCATIIWLLLALLLLTKRTADRSIEYAPSPT